MRRPSISRTLRYDILKRDNFVCRLCGRGAGDGVKLEIDHKTSVADGGATDITNLWTLCYDCNHGKRANTIPGAEPKPPTPTIGETVTFQFRVAETIHEAVKNSAAEEGISIADYTGLILQRYLEKIGRLK